MRRRASGTRPCKIFNFCTPLPLWSLACRIWRVLCKSRRPWMDARTGPGVAARPRGVWACGVGSDRIIHLELDRVGGVLEIVHLLPLQLRVRLDQVHGED